jgi:hypothetical protein
MIKQKLDLLIVEYWKQLGMRNLEYKSVAGTTHLIEVKWLEFSTSVTFRFSTFNCISTSRKDLPYSLLDY